jgi:hypothetical protein
LRWSFPRELLWAIIFSQLVFLVFLWPSQYPYGQAPKIDREHQTKDGVSSAEPAEHSSPLQINPSGKSQVAGGGEHPTEVTILGIKPGEWLLSIVTLMLWGATVRLVRSAEEASAEQSRDMKASVVVARDAARAAQTSADALISSKRAHLFVIVVKDNIRDIIGPYDRFSSSADREHELETPGIAYSFKNFGKTHATIKEVAAQLVLSPKLALDTQPNPESIDEPIVGSKCQTEEFGCLLNDTLTIGGAKDFKERKSAFWLDGYIVFEDAFGVSRRYQFTLRYRSGENGFRLQWQAEYIQEPNDSDDIDDQIPF